MNIKIPPVLVCLLFGLAMYLLARFLPVGYFDFFGRRTLMQVLILLAAVVSIMALIQFWRARTTIDTSRPEKVGTLVTSGIYRISRNPMYLALLLLLLAWGLWLGNAFNTITAAGFVSFMNAYQIKREEAALRKKFGKVYEQYCIKVRRWF